MSASINGINGSYYSYPPQLPRAQGPNQQQNTAERTALAESRVALNEEQLYMQTVNNTDNTQNPNSQYTPQPGAPQSNSAYASPTGQMVNVIA